MNPMLLNGQCAHGCGRVESSGGCIRCTASQTFCGCGQLVACGCGLTFDHDCPNVILASTWVFPSLSRRTR